MIVKLFRSLLKTVANSGIFEKIGDSLCFATNVMFIQENKYYDAGKFVAWSVLHGGCGLHMLAIECLALLRGEIPDIISWLPYVTDERLKDVLEKVIRLDAI